MSRRCTVCNHPNHARIDAALASAASVAELVAKFGIGESSLYRHARSHLKMTLLQQTRFGSDLGPASLIGRLVEALDDATAVRGAALMAGNGVLVLRAANTIHTITTDLMDRLGIDDLTVLDSLREGDDLINAVAALVRKAPKVGDAIADEVSGRSPELAAALRGLAERVRVNSVSN